MGEFKGTKGKWELKNNEYGYNTSVFTDNSQNPFRTICVSRVNDQEQNNANLLLISKAPEMLEMLKKCKEYFLLKTDAKSEERADAIGQLIKEATQI
jgi:hypothetical protein